MPEEKGDQSVRARLTAKQQRETVRLDGLRACRLAAALTQRELAEMVGSNQTTIADLENWDEADTGMLRRLSRSLHVASEDLVFRGNVEEPVEQLARDPRAASDSTQVSTERRRQVNRIKRRGHFANPYSPGFSNMSPGKVLLRGLKDCRVAAGLTQRELARMIGSNQTTIQQLEKGTHRGAYMGTVKKLCRALGVSPADVICRPEASVQRRGGE